MAEKEKKKPDWAKIKAEYVANRTPYRKLAEKYGVSFSTLKERARRERWTEDAKATQEKVRTKLTQKLAEKKASILAQELDPALEATNLINQLVLDALNDNKQFRRHLVQRREKEMLTGTEKWWVEEQEFDVIDTRRLRDLAQALKISKELQRLLEGIVDPATEKKLAIEQERLELEKTRAGIGDCEDDETGIVILPEVKSVDQEQQQEGADDE